MNAAFASRFVDFLTRGFSCSATLASGFKKLSPSSSPPDAFQKPTSAATCHTASGGAKAATGNSPRSVAHGHA
jgi:hypothetical protein